MKLVCQYFAASLTICCAFAVEYIGSSSTLVFNIRSKVPLQVVLLVDGYGFVAYQTYRQDFYLK